MRVRQAAHIGLNLYHHSLSYHRPHRYRKVLCDSGVPHTVESTTHAQRDPKPHHQKQKCKSKSHPLPLASLCFRAKRQAFHSFSQLLGAAETHRQAVDVQQWSVSVNHMENSSQNQVIKLQKVEWPNVAGVKISRSPRRPY